jgi:hypothetical protein
MRVGDRPLAVRPLPGGTLPPPAPVGAEPLDAELVDTGVVPP